MTRQQQQCAVRNRYRLNSRGVPLNALLVLACFLLAGCQTVQPRNNTLKDMQEWATPEPLDRVSPPREQTRAKAAMVRWTEQYLKDEYKVFDQRFVLTQPGFTEGASVGSKANQYVTQNLGGALKIDGWYDDENYRIFLFAFGDDSPRYIAFVITRGFLPGTRERRLVGYFELVPTAKH
jgi:hypothetical protein